jgi:acyl dehydratase
MPINPDTLLNYAIPEVRQTITDRDAVLYALSLGVGADPTDAGQLRYVGVAPVALPWMPLVLAHPGFWLGNPDTGVNAAKLVHGEQGLELHRPMPVSGTFVGRTRVTGLVDKGPGRGALLYSEKTVTDAATGDLIAVATGTTFLRGDGGFGGTIQTARPPNPLPDSPADHVVDIATHPEQALLYRLNGDNNPLHIDPQVAAAAGFPQPISHGSCTFGIACHAILRTLCDYEADRFGLVQGRFSNPAYPGDTIRVEIWQSGAFRARVLERDLVVIDNGLFRRRPYE